MKVNLTFYSGTDSVTGSNFMVEVDNTRVLVDCGLVQGTDELEARNYEEFGYDPSSVDVLVVTHAHMDHIGRIPRLVSQGFKGRIISTAPTRDLSALMYQDALTIMSFNEKEHGATPLYSADDVSRTSALWESVEYHESFTVGPLTLTLKDAGHILGSAMVRIEGKENSILFTGDLGNSPSPLLPDTEPLGNEKYLVTESVYGDRNHEPKATRTEMFKKILRRVIREKGTLLIPAFSIERTQVLLFELNNLIESGELPSIPIYLDSPLAINVTDVYARYTNFFKEEVRDQIQKGDDVFKFPGLLRTYTKEDSKEINETSGAKIIIAGSGMSHGGRILHHELHRLGDPNTTLLLVGYQVPGSVGRKLQEGIKRVTILGTEVDVKARIETLLAYSAHKDSDHIQEFIATGESLEKVFVVLGELKSRIFLGQRIHDYLGLEAVIPQRGESFEINL